MTPGTDGPDDLSRGVKIGDREQYKHGKRKGQEEFHEINEKVYSSFDEHSIGSYYVGRLRGKR